MCRSAALCLFALSTFCMTVQAEVNETKEYPNAYHSPAAEKIAPVFHSVVQMELVVKKGDADASVQYVNGVVLNRDGLIASVVNTPGEGTPETGGIEAATILMLDGSGAKAELVRYSSDHGVALFQAPGLDVRPIALAETPLVGGRRVLWHTVFKEGRKTYLYTRALKVYKASHTVGSADDLCLIIDHESSSLTAERSGSALVGPDGTLLGLMGYQPHWNLTKNQSPRTKTAWAVPAAVIAELIAPQDPASELASTER